MKFTVVSATLLSIASLVVCNSHKPNTKSYIANFDDLSSIPLTSLETVGLYDGLYYSNGFVLVTAGLGPIQIGIQPKSGTNVLAIGAISELTGGPAILEVNADKGTKISNFRLRSLYLACVLTTEASAASVAVPCTIKAEGKRDGHPSVNKSLTFTPAEGTLRSPMTKITFGDDFYDLVSVTFSIEVGGATKLLTSALIDNIDYTTYAYN